MQVLFNLEGVPAMKQFLQTANEEVQRAVGNANRDTAFAIQRRARGLVPKDRGDLSQAITVAGRGLRWRVGLDDRSVPSRQRANSGRRGGNDTSHIHPWVYGIWQEFGFRTRGIRSTPFMVPSYNAEEPTYQARQEAAVNQALSKLG